MEHLPVQLEQNDILLPETKQAVIKLWSDFHTLCKIISHYKLKAEQYLEDAQTGNEFINVFCSLGDKRLNNTKERVAPYMHTILYHVPIIIKKISTTKKFSG